MCVGPNRLYEAMATLKFDYMIYPRPDQTYIITPYSQDEFFSAMGEFLLSSENFVVVNDGYFEQHYDLGRWTHDNWYKQQAYKLCSLDHFDSEYFLLQDADVILLKPYTVWASGDLNFKAEPLWNDHHRIYAEMVKKIIGMDRAIPYSLVNELMPYGKTDWLALKELLGDWINLIPNIRPFDGTKWFSEYELLGIYKTNQTGWTYFSCESQPPVNTWADVWNADWTQQNSLKFHADPLKFMDKDEAHQLVRYVNDTIN
jgi:hypothetical protein